jgi:hypothetical protein
MPMMMMEASGVNLGISSPGEGKAGDGTLVANSLPLTDVLAERDRVAGAVASPDDSDLSSAIMAASDRLTPAMMGKMGDAGRGFHSEQEQPDVDAIPCYSVMFGRGSFS